MRPDAADLPSPDPLVDCEPFADAEEACCVEAACAEAACDALDGFAALRIAVVLLDAEPCDVLVFCSVVFCLAVG